VKIKNVGQSIAVHQAIDSGNISVTSIDQGDVHLRINNDAHSEFLQWFHFHATGIRHKDCRFVIENAGATTYPKGWEGYTIATSFDQITWTRTPAIYDGTQLSWNLTCDGEYDQVWFAYFAPYSQHQHQRLIAASSVSRRVNYECLGNTYQGRTIDYLRVSSLIDGRPNESATQQPQAQLWVIARQHPGESMAEWFMQGFLERLLNENDATSCALRAISDIHVVPNMNPDGSYLGHLRTNALGVNLNREWQAPSIEKSPEVYYVQERMRQTGITLALDVHGDEALPYNFIAGTEGIVGWTDERNTELVNVKHTWASINPDFQTQYGYPINKPGKANLSICSNYLAHTFDCLAMTLEMPGQQSTA